MNVNGINDPEAIKARAQNLLSTKQKVDLGKEDLETLWENAKLSDSSISEIGITDEEAIAQFDLLDNEDNTAATSYKLFLNWIKGQASASNDAEVTTASVESAPQAMAYSARAATVEETNTAADSALEQGQKTYVQIFGKESTTIDVDGKQYSITNTSKTVNNFAYYVQNGVVMIEGSDLEINSVEDNGAVADNIKLMGNRNTINVGAGDDIVEVEGDMNSIFAGEGDDFVKMRGDYNTTNGQNGNDTVWIAGNTNVAIGASGDDNFFAIGAGNTLYGQEDTDGLYYNETKGIGHDYRVENTITDGTDFEKWVKGDDPVNPDEPPYINPPDAADGHEVRAYDDNTYTDKYEEAPNYITEYRDIAYRELHAKTTVDRTNIGNATVTKYDDEGAEKEHITITPENVTIKQGDTETTIPAADVVYKDSNGNVITNTGTIDNLVEMLATGKYTIDIEASSAAGNTTTTPVDPDDTTTEPPVTDPSGDETVAGVETDPPKGSSLEAFTPEAVDKLNTDFSTLLSDKVTAAGQEYQAAMSNKKADGTFDTSDDAAASQKYASVINQIDTKRATLTTAMPLISKATSAYAEYLNTVAAGGSPTTAGTKLHDYLSKLLTSLEEYLNNDDVENDEALKNEVDEAAKQLEELNK